MGVGVSVGVEVAVGVEVNVGGREVGEGVAVEVAQGNTGVKLEGKLQASVATNSTTEAQRRDNFTCFIDKDVLSPIKSYRAKSHKVVSVRLLHNVISRQAVLEKGNAS